MPTIVFMGTPEFALPSLEACLELGDVVAVVTQPDKPRGRGQTTSFSPVKSLAHARNLEVLQPQSLKGTAFAETLSSLKPDVGVVTAYGKILPPDVLRVPTRGCVNVHASLLPRFRGAAPIQRAIAAGDQLTGVTLMKMDDGLDTGPIIDRAELPILPSDTSATLHDKLAQLGGTLLRRALPAYLRGTIQPVPQSAEGVLMAPMIRKEEGALDFRRPAEELERRIRAFTPWPGAFTHFEHRLLKIHRATVRSGQGEPGVVLASTAQGIEVACGTHSLLLEELQPEGRRSMAAQEFLAGRKVSVGSRPFESGPSGASGAEK